MLVLVQFPICDARPFVAENGYRIGRPQWPLQDGIPRPFVRCFGPKLDKSRVVNDSFVAGAFCGAARALRFPGLRNGFHAHATVETAGSTGLRMRGEPIVASRRLACDNLVVEMLVSARVEVLFAYVTELQPGLRAAECVELGPAAMDGPNGLFDLVRRITQVPTRVHYPSRKPSVARLIGCRGDLVELYARATTEKPGANGMRIHERWLEAGTPLVVVDVGDTAPEGMERFCQLVNPASVGGARVGSAWLRVRGGSLRMWVIARGESNAQQARALRHCIVRLHAEREALNYICNMIKLEAFWEQVDDAHIALLHQYLNVATKFLYRRAWGDISRSAIFNAFDAWSVVVTSHEELTIRKRLEWLERQVRQKVEAYHVRRLAAAGGKVFLVGEGGILVERNEGQIIQNSTVYGHVINRIEAERIENSFNLMKESSAVDADKKAELQQAVQKLHEQIAALLEKIPEGDAERRQQVLEDVENMAAQIKKEKPRREWLKVSAEGLVNAAKAVAEMAEPIAKSVRTILTLVGFAGLI